jgi:hypothetical protein
MFPKHQVFRLSFSPGVPPDSDKSDLALSWPGRLRSSVSKFTWTGNSYVAVSFHFQNPPKSRMDIKPAQCFKSGGTSTKYHCSNSGSLSTVPLAESFVFYCPRNWQ